MTTGIIITIIICLTLVTLSKLSNDHKAKMAQIEKDGGTKR